MDLTHLVGTTLSSPTSQYQVESLIGEGSFGSVALCRKDPSTKVALKILDASVPVTEAEKEVQILHGLRMLGSDEFSIVHFEQAFAFNGRVCLEFEHLDVDLYHHRHRHPLTLGQIRPVMKQLAEALSFLCDVGVVHSDLKPENIMLVDRQQQPLRVKVIDFGQAVTTPIQVTDQQLQTLPFRAPEVLLGAPLSQAIDVWSLGCIAAELLTGKSLFEPKNQRHMMWLIVSTVGMPPQHILDTGHHTTLFFEQNSAPAWTPKTAGTKHPVNICWAPAMSLGTILQLPVQSSAEEAAAAELDRTCFVDLVVRMLSLDPVQRIRPQDLLRHPFLTTSHLTGSCSSYLQSSAELLKLCSRERHPPAGRHPTNQATTSQLSSEAPPSRKRKRSPSPHLEGEEPSLEPPQKRRREDEDPPVFGFGGPSTARRHNNSLQSTAKLLRLRSRQRRPRARKRRTWRAKTSQLSSEAPPSRKRKRSPSPHLEGEEPPLEPPHKRRRIGEWPPVFGFGDCPATQQHNNR